MSALGVETMCFPNHLCSVDNVGVQVSLSHLETLTLKERRQVLGGDGSKFEPDRILRETVICACCQREFLTTGGNAFYPASALPHRDSYGFSETMPEDPGGQDRAHGKSDLTSQYRAVCIVVLG